MIAVARHQAPPATTLFHGARMSWGLAGMYIMFVVFPFLQPVMAHDDPVAYLGFIPYVLFMVCLTADTARAILTHPFSYTLPAHLPALRRQLLTIAVVVNACFMVPMLLYPAASVLEKVQAMLAVYCAGMALYFGAALIVFRVGGTGKWAGLLFLLVVIPRFSDYAPVRAFANGILQNPALFAMLAVVLLQPFWGMFSQRDTARRLVGSADLSFGVSMDFRSARDHRADALVQERIQRRGAEATWLQRLSERLAHAESAGLFCFRHQAALALRRFALGIDRSGVRSVLGLCVACFVILSLSEGRTVYREVMRMLFVGFAFFAPAWTAPHSPFLPYERSDVARTVVLMGFVRYLICLVWALLAWGFMSVVDVLWLQRGLDLELRGPVGFNSVLFPFYLVIWQFRDNWRNYWGYLFFGLVFNLAVFLSPLYEAYRQMGPGIATLLHLAGWVLYVPVAYWRSRRRDMVVES